MKKLIKQNPLKQLLLIFSVFLVCISSTIFGQTITSVAPNSAAQGTLGLVVTFTIAGPELPPADLPVDEVTIGTIQGTSLVHESETEVSAMFNIPSDEELGAKDVAVTFIPPMGDPLIFSLTDGFTITEMEDIAPVIAIQPESNAIIIGNPISLYIGAYGMTPLYYQWQKDEIDIEGATTDTYTIDAFSQEDVGSYRCIVTNDLGIATSDIAELTIYSPPVVTSVSPNSAAQGTSNLLVTFIISGDPEEMPPPDAPVDMVTIGEIEGTTLTHNDTEVTGIFNISFNEEIGSKDVAVTFTPPPGQGEPTVFLLADGFTVTEMEETVPIIVTQPMSDVFIIGQFASLYVEAYGTNPISYQWRKDGVDIPDGNSSIYSISSFAESDAGSYLCVLSNALGTITSDEAELTVDTTNYEGTFPIVATGQVKAYNDFGEVVTGLEAGDAFYGQDGHYQKGAPISYTDNGDGTVTDNATGLMWAQDQSEEPTVFDEADDYCSNLVLAGYDDWRLPTLKELWSIRDQSTGWPYVDTTYFHLVSSDGGEQSQQHSWSCNAYLVDTPEAMKGVNWIVNDWTGHIKALDGARYIRAIRGDVYGINAFVNNSDSLVTDIATGLMWSRYDSKEGMNWEAALAYAENSTYAGHDDWRLPNIKELHSLADYSGVFPVIDTNYFHITGIINEAFNADYPYFWSSTSAGNEMVKYFADYVAFGYAVEHQEQSSLGEDIHGAGGLRFDTKVENGPSPSDDERIYNYVRLVRDVNSTGINDNYSLNNESGINGYCYPNPFSSSTTIGFTLPKSALVTLSIYNSSGVHITTIINSVLSQGNHEFQWQAANLPSGTYYYSLKSGEFIEMKQMILVK